MMEKIRCSHFPACGGCKFQDIEYAEQVKRKEQQVAELFASFDVKVQPCIPSPIIWEYRNKMEFTFSQNKAGEKFLGLILAKSRGYVFHLVECPISPPWFSKVLIEVRNWWQNSSLRAYNMRNNEGSLRYLTVREGKRTGHKMVMLTVSGNPDFPLGEHLETFVKTLKAALPEENHFSIFLRIQQTLKGTPTQFYEMHLSGPDHILEELHVNDQKLIFKISPTSFFQPNTLAAEVLYTKALEMLGPQKSSLIYDLYCGTATIGMALAKSAKKVVGIELNPHAVFDAEANKELNNIQNIEIIQGDVGKALKTLSDSPEIVVVDPPRAGLDPTALNHLLELKPPKILYISCNPATQAQNIAALEGCYSLKALQPIDQFPHTPHIENVAILERKG